MHGMHLLMLLCRAVNYSYLNIKGSFTYCCTTFLCSLFLLMLKGNHAHKSSTCCSEEKTHTWHILIEPYWGGGVRHPFQILYFGDPNPCNGNMFYVCLCKYVRFRFVWMGSCVYFQWVCILEHADIFPKKKKSPSGLLANTKYYNHGKHACALLKQNSSLIYWEDSV